MNFHNTGYLELALMIYSYSNVWKKKNKMIDLAPSLDWEFSMILYSLYCIVYTQIDDWLYDYIQLKEGTR